LLFFVEINRRPATILSFPSFPNESRDLNPHFPSHPFQAMDPSSSNPLLDEDDKSPSALQIDEGDQEEEEEQEREELAAPADRSDITTAAATTEQQQQEEPTAALIK
jgi:hypothetical protein